MFAQWVVVEGKRWSGKTMRMKDMIRNNMTHCHDAWLVCTSPDGMREYKELLKSDRVRVCCSLDELQHWTPDGRSWQIIVEPDFIWLYHKPYLRLQVIRDFMKRCKIQKGFLLALPHHIKLLHPKFRDECSDYIVLQRSTEQKVIWNGSLPCVL